jgi:hypothetical protein
MGEPRAPVLIAIRERRFSAEFLGRKNEERRK